MGLGGLGLYLEQQSQCPASRLARPLSLRSCQDSFRHGHPLGICRLILPEAASDLRNGTPVAPVPTLRVSGRGRHWLGPHPHRHGSGRPTVSCRLPGATSLAGAGPATGGPGGRHPRSQPVAHHRHPAHPLPTESLLQYSTDGDKRAGPSRQQRGPPVLSRGQPDTGRGEEADPWTGWGRDFGHQSICLLPTPGHLTSQGGGPPS